LRLSPSLPCSSPPRRSPPTRSTEIKDGKLKDGELTFSVTRERNGQSMTTKYQGKVDGDKIKGKMMREGGQGEGRDWEAKRAKDEK